MNRESPQSQLTRRRMLKIAAAGTAGVGVGTLLGACVAPATAPSPTPAGTPAGTPAATPTPRALEKTTFMSAFRVGTSDCPWFLAKERGYFEDEGIDFEFVQGTGSATTARVVGAGSVTFGAVDGGVVIRSAGTGIPIRAVAGNFQTGASACVVRRESGIAGPKDLEGTTLVHGPGSASGVLFPGWMRVNGADPNTVEILVLGGGAAETTFIQGNADGVLTFALGSFVSIQDAGVDAIALKYSDFGFNIPGNALVANALTIRDRPELVRGFATAAMKGLEDTLEDTEAALDALIKNNPDLAPQREELAKSRALEDALVRTPATEGKSVGWMDPGEWQRAIDLLKEYGGLREVPKLEEVIFNVIPETS